MIQEKPLDNTIAELEPPFTLDIIITKCPSKFHLPQIKSCNELRDHIDYLESFHTFIKVQGASRVILSQAFPLTLVGKT